MAGSCCFLLKLILAAALPTRVCHAWAWTAAGSTAAIVGVRQRHLKGKAVSKRSMHREALLFNKQTLRHKTGHRFASAMEIVHKTAYWGTVKMGTPAQEFKVIFDTGSGNLIIPHKSCGGPGCFSHKKYDPQASSSGASVLNEKGEGSTEISFGTGDISGDYYKDHFCIAESLCAEVRFVAATQQSPEPFSETPFDGILGLGFKDLSMGNSFNIVDDLQGSGQLPQGTFAVFLTDGGDSEITFGGYRPESVASDIVWADVDRQSYWQVNVDDITFNNRETGLCGDNGCQVAVDTGTSMLAGPSDLVDKLSSKLGAKDDCSNFDSLPTIGFKIDDKVLNLAPDDYMDKSAGDCSFSLMSLDVPPPKGPLFIFGDPFLRRFVTVYDRRTPRVGFAVAKHGGMDERQASRIISRVAASDSASGNSTEAQEAKLLAQAGSKAGGASGADNPTNSAPVAVRLDAGMMTGAQAGEASGDDDTSYHSHRFEIGASSNDAPAPEADATTQTVAPAHGEAVGQGASESKEWADRMRQMLDNNAFVQQYDQGLEGRRGGQPQLFSVRLHQSAPQPRVARANRHR